MIDNNNDDSSVFWDNLSSLSEEQTILEERRICEIKELVSGILDGIASEYGTEVDVYTLLSLFSDKIIPADKRVHRDSLLLNKSRLYSFLHDIGSFDKFLYSDILIEALEKQHIKISEDDFLLSERLPETFVYVKNAFADEAYDVFSQSFTDPRVRYAENFKEILVALEQRTAAYCLLPLEESGGKRIRSVEEIILKNDLKINGVTPVFGFDGSADMKYALVSKEFCKTSRERGDDRYLEIRMSFDTKVHLAEIFSAAYNMGLSVYRVDTSYLDSDDGTSSYITLVFKSDNTDFTKLLVYLTLYTQSYVIVGLYKNLE